MPLGTMQTPMVAVPLRSFRDAKQRLSTELGGTARARLAAGLASRTAETIVHSGAAPVIVSSSADVASWASSQGYSRLPEAETGGLNGAANTAAHHAGSRGWLILHSDLPCLTAGELQEAYAIIGSGSTLLAPSYDGGTTAIGGHRPFPFAYGPGSFHRHLHAAPDSHVLTSLGFLLDIDGPADLAAARAHPRGAWLNNHLE